LLQKTNLNAEEGISDAVAHAWQFIRLLPSNTLSFTLNQESGLFGPAVFVKMPKPFGMLPMIKSLKELNWILTSYSDRTQQIEYIRFLHKPLKMECKTFLIKLRNLNAMALMLPGTASVLNDDSVKRCFFDAMPISWQTRFDLFGRSIERTEIKDLCTYFFAQEMALLAMQRQRNGNGKHRRSERGSNNWPSLCMSSTNIKVETLRQIERVICLL
jgi:hypothetical protein